MAKRTTRRKSTSVDPVEAYARAVIDDRVLAGKPVRLACQRHLRDLSEAKDRGLVWNRQAAERAVGFFPDVLRLAEGQYAEQPFRLQPWEQFIVGSLFGWHSADGYRRFRTCYAEVGKGNGKSPLAAGIGLYGLVADGEAGAEIYSAATTRDQAKIVWGDAAKMVAASPALKRRIHQTINNLAYLETQSFFRNVSADASKLDGFRPHIVIADEVHEHPNAMVIDKMRAGFKGRRQPLMIEITNSGFDRNSVCFQHHEYSLKVLEGIIENDSWFAYVCALDDGDDPFESEECWGKANPNLGVSVPLKYLREQVAEAKGMPSKQNIVRRLNFCQWTNAVTRWIPPELWALGSEPVDVAALQGRVCYAGLDLAAVRDLTSLALLFPPVDDGERWKIIWRHWCPEDDIDQRAKRDRAPYDVWVREHWLTPTPGNTTDFSFVLRDLIELAHIYQIQKIGIDRLVAQGGGAFINDAMDEGLPIVEFGQGFLSMSPAAKEFERLLLGGMIQHGGNPIARWCSDNVVIRLDPAGNIKPDKERSIEKIDAIVAAVEAVGVSMKAAEEQTIYSDGRDLAVI